MNTLDNRPSPFSASPQSAQQQSSASAKPEPTAYQDESSYSGSGTSSGSTISKDFITLLTAQMANQDPSNPMEAHEMTAQLAQIAALEQQEGTNQLMAGLIAMVGSLGNFAAMDAVGKEGVVALDKFKWSGDGKLEGKVDISDANAGSDITVKIEDESGKTVKEIKAEIVDGEAKWEWDGTDSSGNKVAEGEYKVSASQTAEIDGKEETVKLQVTTESRIGSINFLNGMITMDNGVQVPFSSIISIAEQHDSTPDEPKEDDKPVHLPSTDLPPVKLPDIDSEDKN